MRPQKNSLATPFSGNTTAGGDSNFSCMFSTKSESPYWRELPCRHSIFQMVRSGGYSLFIFNLLLETILYPVISMYEERDWGKIRYVKLLEWKRLVLLY